MLVKMINELGIRTSYRSAGIVVLKERLLPAPVFDGPIPGHDYRSQASVTTLSANWQKFNAPDSNLQIDHSFNVAAAPSVERYEVAVGSRAALDDVMAFKDVGLKTVVTLSDLKLTPGATYYVTVRGSSKFFSSVQRTSDGITVGVNATVECKLPADWPMRLACCPIKSSLFQRNQSPLCNGFLNRQERWWLNGQSSARLLELP